MASYITLYDAVHDSHHEEYAELRINADSIVWCGLDYDGNTVVGYQDADSMRVVRVVDQTPEEILGDE